MERNNLMSKCYPRIKDYCREKHGLEFQVGYRSINNVLELHKQLKTLLILLYISKEKEKTKEKVHFEFSTFLFSSKNHENYVET